MKQFVRSKLGLCCLLVSDVHTNMRKDLLLLLICVLLINPCVCCNTTFSLLEGTIKTPNDEGSKYSNNLLCTYTVMGSDGKQEITLEVESFHLESYSSCSADYLKLGESSKYCGKTLEGRTLKYEFTNSFQLVFKTDGSLAYSGFTINYKVSCNTTYSAPEGVIVSPPGPGSQYPHNAACTYTITGGIGRRYVTFTAERFSLESDSSCSYDYLKFGDGSKYCGNTLKGKSLHYKFGASTTLDFKTDGSSSSTGFLIRYLITCNTTYSTYEGTIGSPVWSNQAYPNDVLCAYSVLGSTGRQDISFTVEKFLLESSCNYDYLQFNSGRKYCGNSLQGDVLNYNISRSFKLLFKTDSSKAFSGFIIKYKVNCNTTFTADVGTIKSPLNESSHYPNDIYCIYTIHGASRPQNLEMTVQSFSLEDHGSCRYDYLRFGEGQKYCGDSLEKGKVLRFRPALIVYPVGIVWHTKLCAKMAAGVAVDSPGSRDHQFTDTFKLYFKTDSSKTRKGFVIDYKIKTSCETGRYGPDCGSSCSEGCSGECNKIDGTCSCKSGYTGTKCDSGCSRGRYGSSCNGVCSSGCADDCNKQDGKCTCKNGKTGPKCETDCPDGTYGYYCVKSCSQGCTGDVCNKDDGGCSCKPGYTGRTCSNSCDAGKYGESCADSCSEGCSDVCNTRDGICTCKSGYMGSRCDTVCEAGKYGDSCESSCSEGCSDVCNTRDGTCTCKSGYMDSRCDVECSKGSHGSDCSRSCNTGCEDICDTSDGSCTCKPGYKGKTCETACGNGTYGRSCASSCSEGCSGVCNTRDGTCTCKSGYMGSMCNIACDHGKYGRSCVSSCSEGCSDVCNTRDGTCTCKSGYMGSRCEIACGDGKYGVGCASSCSEGCSKICSTRDGTCTCKPGYMGSKCDIECSNGTHGNGCSGSCSPGCEDICDKSDGSCTCKSGYKGQTCETEPTLSSQHVTSISSACGVAGLVIVVLLIVVFKRHRRRKKVEQQAIKRKDDMELTAEQPKTIDTNWDADSVIYVDPDEIQTDPVYENTYTPQPGCSVSQNNRTKTLDVRALEEESSSYLNLIVTPSMPVPNGAHAFDNATYENIPGTGVPDNQPLYSLPIDH